MNNGMRVMPEVAILPITYRCNAKCKMCGIGNLNDTEELSLAQYEGLFQDKIWKEGIRSVNITGGEPFLRGDISRIIELLAEGTTNLSSIVINTNGILTKRIIGEMEKILPMLSARKIVVFVYISLDGIGESHDMIRGVNGCFSIIEKTIEELRKLLKVWEFKLVLNCTITNDNYHEIRTVLAYARQHNIEINYTYAMESDIYFQNSLTELRNDNKRDLIVFLDELIHKDHLNSLSTYYRGLIKMLQGNKRNMRCILEDRGIFVHPSGDIYRCWVYEDKLGNLNEEKFEDIWNNAATRCQVNNIKERCETCYNNCYQSYQVMHSVSKLWNALSQGI